MIDETKLIEYLETLVEFEGKKSQESAEIGAFDMATCYGHGEYCYKNAINAAREQSKIGEWIPCSEPPKHDKEVLIFNGKSYSVGYYDGKTWINAIHPVEWQEIYHG